MTIDQKTADEMLAQRFAMMSADERRRMMAHFCINLFDLTMMSNNTKRQVWDYMSRRIAATTASINPYANKAIRYDRVPPAGWPWRTPDSEQSND